MVVWSTEAIAPRKRFEYWREIICKTALDVSTEADSGDFSARMYGRSVGDIRLVSFECTGHDIVRDRHRADSKPEDRYVFTLHLRGHSHFSQGNETLSLRPHEIAVVDGRLPFRISFKESVSRASIIIPHAMIHDRAPWLKTRPCLKITPASEFADLARRHLRILTLGGDNLSDRQAVLLTENLCNLLAMATRDSPPSRMEPELMRAAIFDYCRRNLHNVDLSPKVVAARFGVAVRTLHLRFQEDGHSFGRWLLQERLGAACKALHDPAQHTASISEIAYGAGFSDLSHFNRSFRKRFGTSPGEWRAMRTSSWLTTDRA